MESPTTSPWGWRLSSKLNTSLFAVLALGSLTSCGKLSIDHLARVDFTASSATIETPAAVELLGSLLQLKDTGTGNWGCVLGGTDDGTTATVVSTAPAIAAQTDGLATLFSSTTHLKISALTLRVRRVNTPSGSMYAEIQSASGSNPTGTLLGQSSDVLISAAGAGATGADVSFPLLAVVEAQANLAYAIVLKPSAGATVDASNNFRWASTGSSAPEGCTDFPAYRSSSNSGSTWGAGLAANLRGFFKATAATHSTTGAVSWIMYGEAGAIWLPISFRMAENANGFYSGTITYDIGAGNDPVTPTYSATNLTKAQVQASAEVTGAYLYVRAHLAVTSGFDQVSVSNGQIGYRRAD